MIGPGPIFSSRKTGSNPEWAAGFFLGNRYSYLDDMGQVVVDEGD
jgi:hypothetical protein